MRTGKTVMRVIPPLAGAVFLSLGAPSFAQTWIEYESRADFFSVNFPGEPQVRDITYLTGNSITLPGRVYSHEEGGSRYFVTVVDYTLAARQRACSGVSARAAGANVDGCGDRADRDVNGAIAHATSTFVQRDAKVTFNSNCSADRVEGRCLQLLAPDGSRTFAAIHMHEDRLYIFEGTTPARAPVPSLFQQSVGFLDKDGRRIRYASIYSNGAPPPPRQR
jgi:hypothetical protein